MGAVPDFDVTKEKIERLLEELRSWEPGDAPRTLSELARMFELDLFVVDRVATSEGHHLLAGGVPDAPGRVDPNASTIDLDPEAVREALEEPDPTGVVDKDTGVWRKKPTGEWELVDGSED
jgi:hypothetical protein